MIVGMLRVKNEARWIARVVGAIKPICERIFILDDHSIDQTARLCQAEGCTVIPSPFTDLNEARDMQFLYENAMVVKPDWIIGIDGDEELEPGGAEKVRAAIGGASPGVSYFTLRILYLWNQPRQIRVDGVYGNFRRRRIFKPENGARFVGNGTAHNLHCAVARGLQHLTGRGQALEVSLLHYGYLYPTDRMAKYLWHNRVEPNNLAEDCFRHIIQGDTLEVPASAKLKHAGPLMLRLR